MTVTLFISMLTLGAAATSLLTEAIKKFYANAGKDYSPNMIALINAIVIGMGGTSICYMLLNILWTVNNIICMVLMGVAVWIASMIGYDKVLQLLKQLADITPASSEASDGDITPVTTEKESEENPKSE